MENRYSGILPGENYIGIRALADFFLFAFKIPNTMSCSSSISGTAPVLWGALGEGGGTGPRGAGGGGGARRS